MRICRTGVLGRMCKFFFRAAHSRQEMRALAPQVTHAWLLDWFVR